jgi:uncharacterized repeat protein (TIGR01451 family)
VPGNNSSTSHTTVSRDADLQVEKTAPATATAGNNITYSLKVTNNGPSDNAGYTLKDVLAAGTSFVSASSGCANASGTVTCTSSGLTAGSNETWTITAHISSGYADGGDLANTASIDTSATADSVPGNNSSTSHTTVNRSADVADLKTAASFVIAGNDITYSIHVSNNGPSDAENVLLSDTLDTHLNNPVYCVGSGCTPLLAWTGSYSIGTLAAGGSVDLTIKATVDPSTPQGYDLANTATVSSTTTDPTPGNNSSTTDTSVQTDADLQVEKTAPATATAGNNITYSLKVTNNGPSDNAGYTLKDVLAAGTSFVSASSGCANASGTVTCTSSGLTAGSNETWTITAHISSGYADGGDLATRPRSTPRRPPTRCPATTAPPRHTTVSRDADLQVEKTAPATATAGNNITYSLKVTNNGPSDNAGYTLKDVLAAGTSFVSASSGCANASGTVTCTSSGLTAGSNETWTITAHISSGYADGGDLANTASIDTSATADSVPATTAPPRTRPSTARPTSPT